AQVRSSLESILDAIAGIADQSRQISASAEQQTAVAVEIDRHVQQISEAAEHTASASVHAQRSSVELAALVQRLNGAMGAFRV
ncbi:MAG: methyl-accepting chemotaxis protein, partial [Pseudomonas sp.]